MKHKDAQRVAKPKSVTVRTSRGLIMRNNWMKVFLVVFNAVAMFAVDLFTRAMKNRLLAQDSVCESAVDVCEGERTAMVSDSESGTADAGDDQPK